jgi:hypothetical protein
MLITNARPVPSAPSASTLPITSSEMSAGAGGAPTSSGVTIASCTVAVTSCAADSATPDSDRPATNRFVYGMPTP